MRELTVEAAANNAAWCDAVCSASGLRTRWGADAWTVDRRSPDGYPDVVTLTDQVDVRALLSRVQLGAGCSVKDSFGVLDLEPWGFRLLFGASWVRRSAARAVDPAELAWHQVQTPTELVLWSEEHGLDVFRPALLEREDLRFFRSDPAVAAGFALNRTGSVVGVSNTHPGRASPAMVWADQVAVAADTYPGLDLVGYEQGDDLDVALAAGFVATGPLRVWIS